jgi:hypothetical protein
MNEADPRFTLYAGFFMMASVPESGHTDGLALQKRQNYGSVRDCKAAARAHVPFALDFVRRIAHVHASRSHSARQVRLTSQADSTDNDERGDSKVGAAPKPARDAP